MDLENKIPLISRLQNTRKEPKIVGHGLETRRGEQITSFKVESDELASYVEKPLRSERAARETYKMYRKLSSLCLPCLSFLKVVRKKEEGEIKYSVAMEDLSAHGENLVLMMGDTAEDPNNPGNRINPIELLEKANNTEEIVDQMARALAVLHNNGIYEYHNKISFFIVVKKSEIGENSERPILEFKILDYSNFTNDGSEYSLRKDALTDNLPGFEHGIEYNLKNLKSGVGDNLADKLEEKYNKYRQEILMTYTYPTKG